MAHVQIATPCYAGDVTDLYLRSVLELMLDVERTKEHAVTLDLLAGQSLLTYARNELFHRFLESEATHLLWLDADIGFKPENLYRLLASGHDVVGTPYPRKVVDWDAIAAMTTAEDARDVATHTVVDYLEGGRVDEHGFARVSGTGTGFLLVSRAAALELVAAYPETRYLPAPPGVGERHGLFESGVFGGRYLSEDYAFCWRWRNLGHDVLVDLAAPRLQHRGTFTFGE